MLSSLILFYLIMQTIDAKECIDKSPYCNLNDCAVRPGYALTYCRRTCGECGEFCQNSIYVSCKEERKSECDQMLKDYCPILCGLCKPPKRKNQNLKVDKGTFKGLHKYSVFDKDVNAPFQTTLQSLTSDVPLPETYLVRKGPTVSTGQTRPIVKSKEVESNTMIPQLPVFTTIGSAMYAMPTKATNRRKSNKRKSAKKPSTSSTTSSTTQTTASLPSSTFIQQSPDEETMRYQRPGRVSPMNSHSPSSDQNIRPNERYEDADKTNGVDNVDDEDVDDYDDEEDEVLDPLPVYESSTSTTTESQRKQGEYRPNELDELRAIMAKEKNRRLHRTRQRTQQKYPELIEIKEEPVNSPFATSPPTLIPMEAQTIQNIAQSTPIVAYPPQTTSTPLSIPPVGIGANGYNPYFVQNEKLLNGQKRSNELFGERFARPSMSRKTSVGREGNDGELPDESDPRHIPSILGSYYNPRPSHNVFHNTYPSANLKTGCLPNCGSSSVNSRFHQNFHPNMQPTADHEESSVTMPPVLNPIHNSIQDMYGNPEVNGYSEMRRPIPSQNYNTHGSFLANFNSFQANNNGGMEMPMLRRKKSKTVTQYPQMTSAQAAPLQYSPTLMELGSPPGVGPIPVAPLGDFTPNPLGLADLITLLGCRDRDPSTCSKINEETCFSRPGYYLKLCPVKCKNCNGLLCYDSVKIDCDEVKARGGCNLPSAEEYCPRTCGKCPSSPSFTGKLSQCKDELETCEHLVKSGVCDHPYSVQTLRTYCAKSCGFCKESPFYMNDVPKNTNKYNRKTNYQKFKDVRG